MTPPSTIAANDHGSHTIPAHVAHLVAAPTDHITIPNISSTTSLTKRITLWALSSHMPSYIAQIAYRLILTIACYVACFPAILACFVIGTVCCNVPRLVAIVAESQVPPWLHMSRAVSSTMSSFATRVANALVVTVACHMSRFSTIPTSCLRGAFWCDVPEKKILDG